MNQKKFLIIAGAPKCGTTTLARLLGNRPDMVLGKRKEPRFLTDFSERTWAGPGLRRFLGTLIRDEATYLDSFSHKPEAEWAIDASTDYLWCPVSAERIASWRERFPTKVICILRDPVQRAISEYQHTIRDGLETETFLGSLQAEQSRMAEGWQPLFYHARRSRYHDDVNRLRDHLGDDLLVMDYHLMKDLPAFLGRVERFLGMPATEDVTLPPQNVSYVYRSPVAAKWVRGENAQRITRRIVPQRLRLAFKGIFEQTMGTRFRPSARELSEIMAKLSDDIAACREHELIPTANWSSLQVREDPAPAGQ